MAIKQERYQVDLAGLQAICSANYLRLMRLLPNMRQQCTARRVAISRASEITSVLVLEVVEACPYTTVLRVREEQPQPWGRDTKLEVRVYHDAAMAEVAGSGPVRTYWGRYPYPNPHMHQPDEKLQVNRFLAEWLSHCLTNGHELEPVSI